MLECLVSLPSCEQSLNRPKLCQQILRSLDGTFARQLTLDLNMLIFLCHYSKIDIKFSKKTLMVLVKSHYPATKQYLPICTYKAFCLEQLKIVSASSISSLSFEEEEEMMDFVGKFIAFTNDMQKAIIRTFN